MAAEGAGIKDLVEALSGEALRDFLRNLRHHTELQRRILRGELDQTAVNRAYLEYARRESSGYRREVSELTVRYYRDLADVGTRFSKQFYDEMLTPAAVPPSVPSNGKADDASVQRVPIELHGEPGREVVARFGLENTDPTPAEVRFEVGPCFGPDGETFTAPLSLHPALLTIPPNDKAEVTIRLAMLGSIFIPGHLYRTAVRVSGHKDLELDVVIWAEDPIPVLPTENPPPAEAGAEASPPEKVPAFEVRCPGCGRSFPRSQPTTRLHPHHDTAGSACPVRAGEMILN